MKTKEVVIEGWANIYNKDLYYGSNFTAHIYKDKATSVNDNAIYKAVKCKLTLEVPEKTVTISESDLAEAWNNLNWTNRSYNIIKSQLFGEGE